MITHLELENLASDYLEGQLSQARRAEVEKHLAGCAACREVVADVRLVMEMCQSAEEVMAPPWLVARIRFATMGEGRTGITEQVNALLHAIWHPRFAYGVAMTVFSLSLIINISGINLRRLNTHDLNPATWVYRANRAGHLLYARAERFYDDLRIVYEIESRFHNARSENDDQEKQTSKPSPPPGRPASTANPGNQQMTATMVRAAGQPARLEPGDSTYEMR
ncbi:MAG TPA: zf-HC2 domain-containing protein [Terriglobia bacterium]|nr:zf-HC2 domain-containing protein [Terriglobia bacterium]